MDEAFGVLANVKRRRLLLALFADSPQNEIPPGALESDDAMDPMQVRTVMRHTHLPKLAEAGYIEWDHETGQIRKGPQFDEIEQELYALSSKQAALRSSKPKEELDENEEFATGRIQNDESNGRRSGPDSTQHE
jgi:hypothetical protein